MVAELPILLLLSLFLCSEHYGKASIYLHTLSIELEYIHMWIGDKQTKIDVIINT